MKVLFLVSAILSSSAAVAADLCKDLIACGTYERSTVAEHGHVNGLKIVIKQTSEMTASLDFTRTENSQETNWPLVLNFDADSSFKATINGQLYATGICNGKLCTFGLRPMTSKEDGDYGIVGVLRFLPNALEYNKMGAGEAGSFPSTMVIPKK